MAQIEQASNSQIIAYLEKFASSYGLYGKLDEKKVGELKDLFQRRNYNRCIFKIRNGFDLPMKIKLFYDVPEPSLMYDFNSLLRKVKNFEEVKGSGTFISSLIGWQVSSPSPENLLWSF
jgi:hypothetical protein